MIRCFCWVAAITASGFAAIASAADWNEWRGSNRNGAASKSIPLAEAWPEGGPPKLWQSAKIQGDLKGGYGSVAVKDGRAYVYSNWKYEVDIPTRTLTKNGLE